VPIRPEKYREINAKAVEKKAFLKDSRFQNYHVKLNIEAFENGWLQ